MLSMEPSGAPGSRPGRDSGGLSDNMSAPVGDSSEGGGGNPRGGGRRRGGVAFSGAPYGASVRAPQPHHGGRGDSSRNGFIIDPTSIGTVRVPVSDEEE